MSEKERYINEKQQRAENNFRAGKSCCQAVLAAFKEELDMDENTLMKLGAPFGGGTGRMRLTCGAATAVFMLAGLLKSDGSKEHRNRDYELVQKLAEELKRENGSIICAQLLKGVSVTSGTNPEERTEDYYKRRPCPRICGAAAKIAALYLTD